MTQSYTLLLCMNQSEHLDVLESVDLLKGSGWWCRIWVLMWERVLTTFPFKPSNHKITETGANTSHTGCHFTISQLMHTCSFF